MRTAFSLSIILALTQANQTFTAKLTQEKGFDMRGFKATKNLNIDKKEKAMFRPDLESYMAENKLQTKLQKLIDTNKAQASRVSKQRNTKKTLRENPQINFKNHYENMIYTGPLYMGSEGEGVQVVYDTGSDWLTVESAQCKSCFGENFDATASESWKPTESSNIEEVEYLSGYIEGYTGTDKVCLSSDSDCINELEFFLIDYNQLLPPDVDGVLGLCAHGHVDDHENGPDFVNALIDAEVVTTSTFAFSLSNDTEQSYIDFGQIRSAGMSDPMDMRYLQLEDHFFWLGSWEGVRYGEDKDSAFSFGAADVIYDTGSSISMIPESHAKAFFQQLLMTHEFVQWEDVFLVGCDHDDWDSVYMLTGDHFWVEYLPEDYILPVPDMPMDIADGLCMLGFMPFEHDFFLAGNNFLRGYYSVHKRDSNQLGLVPNSDSDKSPVKMGQAPKQTLSAQVSYANVLSNIALTWFGIVMWWVFIEGKVPELANSSLQSASPVRGSSKKTVKKSNQKELEETIAKLQAQLASQNEGNSME